jgi:hypothetical protein
MLNNETAILGRVIRPEDEDLSPEAARALLKLGFDDADRDRMNELAQFAQEGTLTAEQFAEVDNYRRVARVIELMHSKARLALRHHEARS